MGMDSYIGIQINNSQTERMGIQISNCQLNRAFASDPKNKIQTYEDPHKNFTYVCRKGRKYRYIQKTIPLQNQIHRLQLQQLLQLKKLNGQNHVVPLVHYQFHISKSPCSEDNIAYVWFESPQIDLRQQIARRNGTRARFHKREIVALLRSCLIALGYLKRQGQEYEAVCPGNIYYSDEGKVMLADPLICESRESSKQFKDVYFSQEYLNYTQSKSSSKIDMYASDLFSLGMLGLELALMERLDSVYEFGNRQLNVRRLHSKLEQVQDVELKLMIRGMLDIDPAQRKKWCEQMLVSLAPEIKHPKPLTVVNKQNVSKSPQVHRNHSVIKLTPTQHIETEAPKKLSVSFQTRKHSPRPRFFASSVPSSPIVYKRSQVDHPPIHIGTQLIKSPKQSPRVRTISPNTKVLGFQSRLQTKSYISTNQIKASNNSICMKSTNAQTLGSKIRSIISHKNGSSICSTMARQPLPNNYSVSSNVHHSSLQMGGSRTLNNLKPHFISNSNQSTLKTNTPTNQTHELPPRSNQSLYEGRVEGQVVAFPLDLNRQCQSIACELEQRQHDEQPIMTTPIKSTQTKSQQFKSGINTTPIKTLQAVKKNLKQYKFNDNYLMLEEQHRQSAYVVKLKTEDGCSYEGYVRDQKRNGPGKFYSNQGTHYQGFWKDDKMHGFGRLFSNFGVLVYDGNWSQGLFEGNGKIYNQYAERNTTPFDYSNFSNIGNLWSSYQGNFKANSKNGYGILKLTNGQQFQGQFADDFVHGKGRYQTLDSQVITGEWAEDKLIRKY